jgi:hypothetical protein
MVGMIGEIPATIISSRAACMHSHNQGHNQLIIAAALQVPLVILTARVRYPYDDRHTAHTYVICVNYAYSIVLFVTYYIIKCMLIIIDVLHICTVFI